MSTLKELLGDKWEEGTRVKCSFWNASWFEPKCLHNGMYWGVCNQEKPANWHSSYSDWEIIKPTKKIILHKYTFEYYYGGRYLVQEVEYVNLVWDEYLKFMVDCCELDIKNAKLLKTESKEIEIDE